jgi:hypothetical protein
VKEIIATCKDCGKKACFSGSTTKALIHQIDMRHWHDFPDGDGVSYRCPECDEKEYQRIGGDNAGEPE